MSSLLHACVYNMEPESSQTLEAHVKALNFVRYVGEVRGPDALADLLNEGGVSLIFFHLDPDPQAVVTVIEQVSTRFPEMALIAASHESDPEAILAPMCAGCDQFVCEPIDPTDLANAVARVASRRLSSSIKSRCICVLGASGGAGATSIACNLALEIGNLVDRDCALVDLDLQFGDVALNFDSEPKFNIFDLAESAGNLDKTVLASTMTKLPCKVALLSRPDQVEQYEMVTPEVIHRVLEQLTAVYENVVVDVPGQFDARSIAALGQADLIIIVCQLSVPSIRNTKRCLDTLTRMGVPDDKVEVVVNRSDGRSGRLTENDLQEAVRKTIFASVPNDYHFVARSIDIGRPIAALDPNSPVRAAIRQMARKIVSVASQKSSASEEERKGFLGRLLSK